VDSDPYVKKTAAISVAKIYQIMPEHTKEFGFIKLLQGLLQDGNPIVVANAAAALFEISKVAGKNYIKANKETIGKLLVALNETNEWGQIYILETILQYKPKSDEEAQECIERITPRLQHANPAVVLGATKNILHFLQYVDLKGNKETILKKLSAPLITLLSAEPEIQYIALCNILLILEQIPNVFEKNVKMFFCRFSDPLYVKLAKVDVMVAVADSTNVDQIISELHTYCNEIDQDLVRRCVRAIGQVVCKVDKIAKKGVEILREHISHEQGSELVLQEAVIVSSKIFRKYPKKHHDLVKDIIPQMRKIEEPESKSAFIWILGEFSKKIEDAQGKLQYFIDSFFDETVPVCLQILTSAVKMYIKDPDNCEEMVMNVLHLAAEESPNPDLRDRGYIYWRMLSTEPTRTKDVVMTRRPEFSEDLSKLMDDGTKEIFSDIGIVKVKHSALKPEKQEVAEDPVSEEEEEQPEKKSKKKKKDKKKKKKDDEEVIEVEPEEVGATEQPPPKSDLDDIFGFGLDDQPPAQEEAKAPTDDVAADPLADIFGSSNGGGGSGGLTDDIFGGSGGASTGSDLSTFIKPSYAEVLSSSTPGANNKASGLQIKGRFVKGDSNIKLEMILYNSSSSTASDFEIMFNKNSFGLKPGTMSVIPLSPGQTFNSTVDCSIDQANADMKTAPSCPYMVQVAVKCSIDVFYFQVP
jgi:vesicle coat complex subunit